VRKALKKNILKEIEKGSEKNYFKGNRKILPLKF